MGLFSIFGGNSIKGALKKGAVIIDLRTPHEFDQGKVPGSINIPFDRIAANAERIRNMKKPVVFCSSFASQSGNAARIMKSKGVKEVYNGGSWEQVLKIYQKL